MMPGNAIRSKVVFDWRYWLSMCYLTFFQEVEMAARLQSEIAPSFSLCFDNINLQTSMLRPSRTAVQHNWTLAYAAKNRVSSAPTIDDTAASKPLAADLHIAYTFVSNDSDEVIMKEHLVVMIKRILCDELAFFENANF